MQKRRIKKKLGQINSALSGNGQLAVIMPADIAERLIKRGDASLGE